MGTSNFSSTAYDDKKREFGAYLKSLRESRGYKYKELATIAELKPDTYLKYEQGVNRPAHYETIEKISDSLGLPKFSEERTRLFWLAGEWVEHKAALEGLPGARCHKLWGRTELIDDVISVLQNPSGAHIIALTAYGGYGKTEVARNISLFLVKGKVFTEVIWLSLKQVELDFTTADIQPITSPLDPTLKSVIRRLVFQLTCRTEEEAKGRLLTQPILVVVDNLESMNPNEREAFLRTLSDFIGDGPSRAIITSRFDVIAPYLYKPPFPGLDYYAARSLLLEEALYHISKSAELANASPDQIRDIWKLTKGMPLALHLVIGQCDQYELHRVITNLEEAQAQGPDAAFYNFLFKQAWQELGKEARGLLVYLGTATQTSQTRLQLLGISPVEGSILDEEKLDQTLAELSRWYLVERVEPLKTRQRVSYDLHPLTRSFVRNSEIRKMWEVEFDEERMHQEATRKHQDIFRKGLG
jgi:transcriptional regulator with XRE-family HTH domain